MTNRSHLRSRIVLQFRSHHKQHRRYLHIRRLLGPRPVVWRRLQDLEAQTQGAERARAGRHCRCRSRSVVGPQRQGRGSEGGGFLICAAVGGGLSLYERKVAMCLEERNSSRSARRKILKHCTLQREEVM
ncbi:hypothetical protein K458DRAFT_423453 [Lentithecium fluviatile CBS 122367]|uniref:Uncharacterized protein n=1 Tax=Lentithecium fluviatile CBS 122367 TaxID=1168545 RepID=A0A6G1IIJ2_9PLEO|nr:hypothetical protein K458DRAFT_423453 [Lentithecium fluviatile CBS 122367]